MTDAPRREYIHSSYSRCKENFNSDLVLVKENLHYPDGRIVPNIRFIRDYQRPFYTTKTVFRDHQQKKEWEYLERLDEHYCTQAEMLSKIKRILKLWDARTLRQCGDSPYLYGTDINSTTLIAKSYMDAEPDLFTPSTYAVLDYETDIINDEKMPISGVLTMKERAICAMDINFFKGKQLPESASELRDLVEKRCYELIGDVIRSRNCKIEFVFVENGAQVVIEIMKRAHAWKPDFIGIWNAGADMKFMLHALDTYGIDPASVFSDPSVPVEYRYFYYREDVERKEKAGGGMAKHYADLWHTIETMASFKFVDSMTVFKHQRARDQARNSYSLKSVLLDYTDVTKFEFEAAAGLEALEYHQIMQKQYPVEYMAYGLMDGFGPEVLDEAERDISEKLRPSIGFSDLSKLKSNPKVLSDNFYFVLKNEGKILTCTGENMAIAIDAHTPTTVDWIIALAAELEYGMGVPLINELEGHPTNIVTHCMDSDLASCYPIGDRITNAGKATTRLEACYVLDDPTRDAITREVGINMTGGKINALAIAKMAFDFPDPDELLQQFLEEEVSNVA